MPAVLVIRVQNSSKVSSFVDSVVDCVVTGGVVASVLRVGLVRVVRVGRVRLVPGPPVVTVGVTVRGIIFYTNFFTPFLHQFFYTKLSRNIQFFSKTAAKNTNGVKIHNPYHDLRWCNCHLTLTLTLSQTLKQKFVIFRKLV